MGGEVLMSSKCVAVFQLVCLSVFVSLPTSSHSCHSLMMSSQIMKVNVTGLSLKITHLLGESFAF